VAICGVLRPRKTTATRPLARVRVSVSGWGRKKTDVLARCGGAPRACRPYRVVWPASRSPRLPRERRALRSRSGGGLRAVPRPARTRVRPAAVVPFAPRGRGSCALDVSLRRMAAHSGEARVVPRHGLRTTAGRASPGAGAGRAPSRKNDAISHPTASFKDRLVAVANNAARGFDLQTVGYASTGNLAKRCRGARGARRTGRVATTARGPRRWPSRSPKLGWRLPDPPSHRWRAVRSVTRLDKGFHEFLAAGLIGGAAPRMYGAQATGCAPIVNLVERGGDAIAPVVPRTIAR